MIVVELTLHSAITGLRRDLGKAIIANDGSGTRTLGNYTIKVNRRKSDFVQREAKVNGHRRLAEPVWTLLRKALQAAGY